MRIFLIGFLFFVASVQCAGLITAFDAPPLTLPQRWTRSMFMLNSALFVVSWDGNTASDSYITVVDTSNSYSINTTIRIANPSSSTTKYQVRKIENLCGEQ